MDFRDMDGNRLAVGDLVEPVEGRRCRIVSEGECEAGYVMFGQQVEDMAAFSILTADNLAAQFRKVGE